jgi:hypothetical protein
MVTFEVDEVAAVTTRLPARPLAEVTRAGQTRDLALPYPAEPPGELLMHGRDGELPVIDHGPTHALLGAVHLAFAQHRPLVLSPDAVWLTIAQGVAQHVRIHGERLRSRLVRHEGKATLEVEVAEVPQTPEAWRAFVAAVRTKLAAHIGDGRARLFGCTFSTSTDIERFAGDIALLDTYAPYFDIWMVTLCGIPSVTLTGTADDWRAIRARIDVIAELDLEPWCRSLRPILDHFVLAAEGRADRAFWQRMVKPDEAYLGEAITGWIARLYPYLVTGHSLDVPNPLLALPIDEPRGKADHSFAVVGVVPSEVPPTLCTVRVNMCGAVEPQAVQLDAGVAVVAQDEDGRLVPMADWHIRRGRAVIQDVVERLRALPGFEPAPERVPYHGVPAELLAFWHLVDRVTLPGDRWRVLGPAKRAQREIGGRTGFPVLAAGDDELIACVRRTDDDFDVLHGYVRVSSGFLGAKVSEVGATLAEVLAKLLDGGLR